MLTLLILSVAAILLAHFIYRLGSKNREFFKKIGIKTPKSYFLLGHTGTIFFRKQSMSEWIEDIYAKFPAEKIIGIFDFIKPVYIIRDPELIKKLTVKDFDHFVDHQQIVTAEDDVTLGNLLTNMSGQKWRDMRSTLSPAFTGSKMRQMFELVTECGEQMSNYFRNESKKSGTQILEMKDVFSRFTNDVIATCAFGIKVDSLEHRDNIFFKMGHDVITFKKFQLLKFTLIRLVPKFTKFFNIQFFDNKLLTFFKSLIIDTMVIRNEKKIVRHDMINLLMQVRAGNLKHEDEKMVEGFATVTESNIGKGSIKREWNDDELVAQCLIFFLAGFDTSSTLLAFAANELALLPEIQDKLYREISTVQEKLEGTPLTYETIQSMQYMDMVISESLRKWSPAPFTNRKCTKDYTIDEGDGLRLTIAKGDEIWIPIYPLQRDAKYFPNPDNFNPERFSDENAKNIVPGTYLPFGIGPRNCIGSRFALMQVKVVLYHLMKDFSFEICEKTVLPIQMGITRLMPEKGIHLALKAR